MDKFHNKVELILAVCVVLCAGLNVVVAYSRWIELLFVMFLAEGYLECLVNIGKCSGYHGSIINTFANNSGN